MILNDPEVMSKNKMIIVHNGEVIARHILAHLVLIEPSYILSSSCVCRSASSVFFNLSRNE